MKSILMIVILTLITTNVHATNGTPKLDKTKQKRIVAMVIAAESCGEGEIGMLAVAGTIRNRALSGRSTAYKVVTAKNQYYGYTAKNRATLYKQCQKTADRLAGELYAGTLKDITGGAEYFLLPNERVRAWHGVKTVKIGVHTFYKSRTK